MTKEQRAGQFMPFAALRGYYEQIRKEEIIKATWREQTEEELIELNRVIHEIKKGDMIKVIYFCLDGFVKKEGVLTELDLTLKRLTIVKDKIEFKDIYKIER